MNAPATVIDAAVVRKLRKNKSSVPVPPPPAEAERATGEWPQRSFLELGALPSAVPCARLHARQVIWEWGLTGLSDSVEIIVSELVTNATHASQSLEQIFPVRLWLLSDKAQVLILVWDSNTRPPKHMDTDENAESGRGLLLVETISDQWGTCAIQAGGKIIWALAATP